PRLAGRPADKVSEDFLDTAPPRDQHKTCREWFAPRQPRRRAGPVLTENHRPPRRPAVHRGSVMLTRVALRSAVCLAAMLLGPEVLRAQEPAAKPLPMAEPPKVELRSLTVYPTAVRLDGPRDEQRLGVLGSYADGRSWDLCRTAKYASSNPQVASVDA